MKTLPHAQQNLLIFWNWPPKNIPDQQKCVAFQKSQKSTKSLHPTLQSLNLPSTSKERIGLLYSLNWRVPTHHFNDCAYLHPSQSQHLPRPSLEQNSSIWTKTPSRLYTVLSLNISLISPAVCFCCDWSFYFYIRILLFQI